MVFNSKYSFSSLLPIFSFFFRPTHPLQFFLHLKTAQRHTHKNPSPIRIPSSQLRWYLELLQRTAPLTQKVSLRSPFKPAKATPSGQDRNVRQVFAIAWYNVIFKKLYWPIRQSEIEPLRSSSQVLSSERLSMRILDKWLFTKCLTARFVSSTSFEYDIAFYRKYKQIHSTV